MSLMFYSGGTYKYRYVYKYIRIPLKVHSYSFYRRHTNNIRTKSSTTTYLFHQFSQAKTFKFTILNKKIFLPAAQTL